MTRPTPRGSNTQKAWVPAFAGMSGILALLAPATALAHPGDHLAMSFAQGLEHMFSQPDHLGLLGLIVLVVVLGAGGAFSRRAPK